MSDLNPDEIQRLNENLTGFGDGTSSATAHLKDFNEAVKKLEILKGLAKDFKSVTDSLSDFADKVGESGDAIDKSNKNTDDEAKKRKEAVKGFGRDLLTAGGSALTAFNDAAEGTGKYAKSVSQMGLSVEKLGGAFGKYGEIAGFAGERLMALAAASLKQNDALKTAYFALGKFGQLDTSDFKDVMHDIHDAGFSVQTAGKYVDIVTKASSDLAMLGKSASDGRLILTEVFQGTLNDEVKTSLMRFGMDTEEMFGRTAEFMTSMSASAKLTKEDVASTHTRTVSYLENLSELSELTGKSRDDMAAARRKQEEDTAFQLKLAQLEESGEAGKREADRMRLVAQTVGATMGEKAQTGIQQYLRSGGAFAGKEAGNMAMTMGQGSMKGLLNYTKQDFGSGEEARRKEQENLVNSLNRAGNSVNRTFKTFSSAMQLSSGSGLKEAGMDTQYLKGGKTLANLTGKGLTDMRDRLQTKPEGLGADRIGELSQQEANERKARQTMDNATYAMGDVAVHAVTQFTDAVSSATDALTTMTDYMGTDDWNRPYKKLDNLADIAETLGKEQKKQIELQTKINENNKQILEYEKEIADLKPEADKGGWSGWWAKQKIGMKESDKTRLQESNAQAKQQNTRSERTTARASAAGGNIQSQGGEGGTDPLAGLKLRQYGDVQRPGAFVHPDLIKKMHDVQRIQGFDYFSSVNDKYHADDGSSAHSAGRAIDIVLANKNPTKEEVQNVMSQIRSMGLSPKDEYFGGSKRKTGQHIHAELKAKTGGVFDGPQSGYKVELHGKEAVVPMNSFSTFGKNFAKEQNDPSKGVTKHQLNASAMTNTTSVGYSNSDNMMRQLMSMLSTKFDDMISELQASASMQGKIAKNTK